MDDLMNRPPRQATADTAQARRGTLIALRTLGTPPRAGLRQRKRAITLERAGLKRVTRR